MIGGGEFSERSKEGQDTGMLEVGRGGQGGPCTPRR